MKAVLPDMLRRELSSSVALLRDELESSKLDAEVFAPGDDRASVHQHLALKSILEGRAGAMH